MEDKVILALLALMVSKEVLVYQVVLVEMHLAVVYQKV